MSGFLLALIALLDHTVDVLLWSVSTQPDRANAWMASFFLRQLVRNYGDPPARGGVPR
ncbi:hypothetical protein [Marinobacter salinexigens]|uniref:hypothetical protein n=1 Tax=Marinobacter salinexigens TaxID=2919747 RepID=UPI00165F25E8|nr:hypothetical protein [Marinobacter salinexigens]